MTVLDDHAKLILSVMKPNDMFTVAGERGVFRCVKMEHPVESEPWVRAQEQEGPKRDRRDCRHRAIRVSRVERILEP